MYIQTTEQIRSIHKTKLQCSEKKSNFVHKTEQYVPKKTEQVWLGKREEFTVAFNKHKEHIPPGVGLKIDCKSKSLAHFWVKVKNY